DLGGGKRMPSDRRSGLPSEWVGARARRHLWLHFTRMSSYQGNDVPVIVRGSGQYVYDTRGKRYLDGLSGLFVSQIGHGRAEVAEAGAPPAPERGHVPPSSYARPRAIED